MRHDDVWRAIDTLAAEYGLSPSGLARKAGLELSIQQLYSAPTIAALARLCGPAGTAGPDPDAADSDAAAPEGTSFRSAVARVLTLVVRDDHDGVRSYLLQSDRSSAQYLFDILLDAGEEFGIGVSG